MASKKAAAWKRRYEESIERLKESIDRELNSAVDLELQLDAARRLAQQLRQRIANDLAMGRCDRAAQTRWDEALKAIAANTEPVYPQVEAGSVRTNNYYAAIVPEGMDPKCAWVVANEAIVSKNKSSVMEVDGCDTRYPSDLRAACENCYGPECELPSETPPGWAAGDVIVGPAGAFMLAHPEPETPWQ